MRSSDWSSDVCSSDLAAAVVDYSAAIERDKGYFPAYQNRGFAYHELRRLAEALADFNQATKLEPDDADVYFARGDVHYDMAEHALAIADYSAGLKLEGDARTEEHTAELQSLMRISFTVFRLKQ